MPRVTKTDSTTPKPKRIRKKPSILNPTYASLKTGSQQKNPIVFVAHGTNIYVMRKLIFTENVLIPDIVNVDLADAEKSFHRLMSFGARSDERAQEAVLSQNDMQVWREKNNVYESTSMYSLLTQDERDKVTLYHVFKVWPGRFVPHPIATVSESATSFWHKQRGRIEPIHCRLVFTGSLSSELPDNSTIRRHEQTMTFDRKIYVPPVKPYITAEMQEDMFRRCMPHVPKKMSSGVEFYLRERLFVTIDNDVFSVPLLALTESDTIPTHITVDLVEVGHIIDTLRPTGVHIDERGRKATMHEHLFDEWSAERNIMKETSMFTLLTPYSRDLVTLYWLFYKSPIFSGIRPFSLGKIQPGESVFHFLSVDNPISCTIQFTGIDPFLEDDFQWPKFE